jgi:hypothetical protein
MPMILDPSATKSEIAEGASRFTEACTVSISPIGLAGTLRIPAGAGALLVFAHGSGSSRLSTRNMAVGERLNAQGVATLLFERAEASRSGLEIAVIEIAKGCQKLHTPSLRPPKAGGSIAEIAHG